MDQIKLIKTRNINQINFLDLPQEKRTESRRGHIELIDQKIDLIYKSLIATFFKIQT